MSAVESSERIDATYESGLAEGLRLAASLATHEADMGRARLAAYRSVIRQAKRDLTSIRESLPADIQHRLAGIEGLLSSLAYQTVEPA